MTNELQIFNNNQFGQVRAIMKDGEAHSNLRAVGEAKYSLCNVVFSKAVQLLHKGLDNVYPQFGKCSAQYEDIQIGII